MCLHPKNKIIRDGSGKRKCSAIELSLADVCSVTHLGDNATPKPPARIADETRRLNGTLKSRLDDNAINGSRDCMDVLTGL